MASFTDEISKFNPYVQQLPVEAMTQVGMYKQQQYDQGVQKIQSYVDNIAGIDVYKQEHKQYLQSKLNELGGRLKTVAAGDFSNAQLVNSVGGMATQIVKDPIVQNAVYSTQVVRKGDADREVAAKAGKTSPNNDAYWENQKAKWLSDGNVNSRFTGQYIEHHDVDKKLTERAEKILKNPDSTTQEQRFKHDERGNTLYYGVEEVKDAKGNVVKDPKTKQPVTRQTVSLDPSKGQPIEDDAITRISIKGVSAEKLYNNFLDSLDSKDAQQLRIDAWAKYKGATVETFAPNIIKAYDDKKKIQSEEIVNLAVALNDPNLSSDKKLAYNARLTDLKNMEKDGVLDKELNTVLESLKDPNVLENYKEYTYTQQHLIDMAKDMSYKSYEQEYKNNPYMQMYMQKQNYNLEVKKFIDDSRVKWANYNLAKDKEAWDRYTWSEEFKNKTEQQKKEWLEKHPAPIVTTTVLPNIAVPNTINGQWMIATGTKDTMDALDNKYAKSLFPGLTPAQIKEGYSKLLKDYETNPKGNYSPDQLAYFKEHGALKQKFMSEAKLATSAGDATAAKKKELMSGYKISGAGGFSGEDILQAQIAIQQAGVTFGKGFGGASYEDGVTYFKANGLTNLLPILDAAKKNANWNTLNANEKAIVDALSSAKEPAKTIAPTLTKFTTDFLATNTPKKLAQDWALDIQTDKTQLSNVNRYLTTVALDDNAIGAGDAKTVLGWLAGEDGGKTKVSVRKLDDGTTQTVFIKADGSGQIILPMSADKQQFFPEVRDSDPYNLWKSTVDQSPNRTTDVLDGRSGAQLNPAQAISAPITGFNLPGFKNDQNLAPRVKFNIEGATDNNGSATDRYSLNMFVVDDLGQWRARRITPEYVQWGGIQNILNNVGKDAYVEAIKTWK
jgi:hypothetical protein